MRHLKRTLAILLTLAIVLCGIPVAFANSESTPYLYAAKLNAEVGATLAEYDFTALDAIPEGISGNAILSPSPLNDGTKALHFGNYWNGDGRSASFNVNSKNYVARLTVVVDNVQTQTIGGTFRFITVGKNANGEDADASYIALGLPDRTVGEPYPGKAIVYNETAEYGFDAVRNVTPFTADCEIETFTFEVYCFNGVNYYVKEDGTLISASGHQSGITVGDTNTIKLFCEYGIAYVTDITVKALSKVVPANPFENPTLIENSGFNTGDVIAAYDFSEFAAGTTPEGWTFSDASINAGSNESAGRNVLRLKNEWGNVSANLSLDATNFAAIATVGIDYAQKLAGTLQFKVFDKNGNFAASWGIGLPKRDESQVLKAGKSVITDNVDYSYPAAGNYTYNTEGYTTVKMIVYFYEGIFSAYWPDGTFVGSAKANAAADLSSGTQISFGNDYGTAYIHDLYVYEITPYVAPVVNELVANSGFISDELIYHANFKNFAAGTTPEGWTFSSAKIGAGSSESAGRNVLRLADDWGYSTATLSINTSNFAAVTTVGIDYAKALAGTLQFKVLDKNGNFAASWGIGLPKRAATQVLKAGKSVLSNSITYTYPAAGAYEYNIDGYTTVTMIIYFYEGILYAYWPDGTFVGSVEANGAADLSGGAQIVLGNDYGTAYIHELKVYEIMENSFKIDSAYIAVDEDNTPLMNFNFSFDDSNSDIISSDNLEFGAVVTVQDTAVVTDTTIETLGAEIWDLEAGAGNENMMYFLKGIEIPAENIDKYYNVRPFVKSGDTYYYNPATTYNPAKLADIFYRSTLDEEQKEIIDEFFSDSTIYFGKESKKTTFTVFADFHYIQGMYISSIADMNEIFDRAYKSGSSFVLSAGDMTNDMKGSPELVNALLNNKYGITAANVYGNHELELGNNMSHVTPTLTNADNVVWGTADGSYNDYIGYYYFEKDGFRIICTDTNYSWDPTNEIWEHNGPGSYGPPNGNTSVNALGPDQIEWLTEVLYDAAEKDIPCIVLSHAAFKEDWTEKSSDSVAVQKLFDEVNAINSGTVMMHISGHAHDDRIEEQNGIVYFRCNTTRNGYWKSNGTDHYSEDDTFMMETYDDEGNFLGYEEKKIGELSGGKNTHFTKEALSATVTIDECGIITIEGMNATWVNNIVPDLSSASKYIRPQISNFSTFDCANGHIWSDNYTVEDDVHYKECINPNCTITEISENAYYGEHEYTDGVCDCGKKEANLIPGDVDGDGIVNTTDLATLKKLVAGLIDVTSEDVVNPDVDGNTLVNTTDLALLKKKIAGLE